MQKMYASMEAVSRRPSFVGVSLNVQRTTAWDMSRYTASSKTSLRKLACVNKAGACVVLVEDLRGRQKQSGPKRCLQKQRLMHVWIDGLRCVATLTSLCRCSLSVSCRILRGIELLRAKKSFVPLVLPLVLSMSMSRREMAILRGKQKGNLCRNWSFMCCTGWWLSVTSR